MQDSEQIRLNKHLALQLSVSRREADELIEKGRVSINDVPASLGARFIQGDVIAVDNKPIVQKTAYQYLLLHKPVGYVCSRKTQGDNPTIYTLLPPEYHALKPVGRLDKDSSGLLLLSNDGDFTYRMTHPKFAKAKQYIVTLNTPLQPLHQQMISDYGIQLEDGPSKFTILREDDGSYQVTMHEGRNRQIRRTFATLGYTVTTLHRTHFGNYSLGDIKPGHYELVEMR